MREVLFREAIIKFIGVERVEPETDEEYLESMQRAIRSLSHITHNRPEEVKRNGNNEDSKNKKDYGTSNN